RAVLVTATQDAAVDLRVRGLDPAVHHFREAGVVGHFHGIDAVVPEQLVGATGGEDFHAQGGQLAGEVDDAGLVGNADQRAADGEAGGLVGHWESHNRLLTFSGRSPGRRSQRRSYCLSFLRRVPRLSPSNSEALVWLPFT